MVIATGFFDGVHLGHRLVIDSLVKTAFLMGEKSAVVTFWPHPRNVLQDDARNLRLLTSLQEKKDILLGLGVDSVEVLNFTKDFSRLTTEEYLQLLKDRYGATAIVLGYDNRMGSGDVTTAEVASIAEKMGLKVIHPDAMDEGGSPISSTRIRKALEAGDVEAASKMLGRPYKLHGVVVAGNRLGRTIGFPTANMQLYEPLKLVPGNGVYVVDVETVGQRRRGMCNIGTRPTVDNGHQRTIETNVFDFSEDIYGLDLELFFVSKIRDERRFDSLSDLKIQLEKDREFAIKK